MKLTGKSLRSDFARFVSATTASLMVFCLYSVVDGLMVARGVGEYAMSAVNLADRKICIVSTQISPFFWV